MCSKRNLDHCIAIVMVNETGEPCCIGIIDTETEKSLDVAQLVFEKMKEYSEDAEDWKIICGKVRGFMGDQGSLNLKSRIISNQLNIMNKF